MSPEAVLGTLVPLASSLALLVAVVLVVWWYDRYDREPLGLVAAVFVAGFAAATALGMVLEPARTAAASNLWADAVAPLLPRALLTPGVAELAKAAVLVVAAGVTRRLENPTDGLVLGAAAGLGFAAANGTDEGLSGVVASLVALPEVIVRAAVHALSSGSLGVLLGIGALGAAGWWKLASGLAGVAAALLVHGGWSVAMAASGALSPQRWLALAPVLLCLWIGLLAGALAVEHRVLVRELAEEVRLGVLPAWVIEVLPRYRSRVRVDWRPERSERVVISRVLTRLAFRKHAIAGLPEDEARLAGLEVVSLRRRARRSLGVQVNPES